MKKLIIISLVILSSCQDNSAPKVEEAFVMDTVVLLDTTRIDSIAEKISTLLISTEHVEKKVTEIKAIKKENTSLKKELVETKAELEQVKAVLADTTSEVKKKKRTFLQKVISTLKKDTIE